MPLHHITISLILAAVAIQPARAIPTKDIADEQLLSGISLSFSKIPLNIEIKKVKMYLTEIDTLNCTEDFCLLVDVDHTMHVFEGKEKRLSKKTLNAFHYHYDKPVKALGIGLAREKSEVLRKISLFLGDKQHKCTEHAVSGMKGYPSYTIKTHCTWTLNEGEVGAKFDNSGQIDELVVRMRY
jgi:hypothetical protein